MEILAAIFGITTIVWLVLGLGVGALGQQLGTWERLKKSDKPWQVKLARFGFKRIMPVGILSTAILIPLILLLGVVTFVVMLF